MFSRAAAQIVEALLIGDKVAQRGEASGHLQLAEIELASRQVLDRRAQQLSGCIRQDERIRRHEGHGLFDPLRGAVERRTVSCKLKKLQVNQRAVIEHGRGRGLLFINGRRFAIKSRRLVVLAFFFGPCALRLGEQGLDFTFVRVAALEPEDLVVAVLLGNGPEVGGGMFDAIVRRLLVGFL